MSSDSPRIRPRDRTRRRQWSIRAMMLAVLVIAPPLTVVRIDPFLGAMAAFYTAGLVAMALAARPAGRVAIPFVVAACSSVGLIVLWGPVSGWAMMRVWAAFQVGGGYRPTFDASSMKRMAAWEAWSLLRWWLLFGAVAWLIGPRAERSWRVRSLLLFSPAFALVEVGMLLTVWPAAGSYAVVPEPSTIFSLGFNPLIWLHPRYLSFWLVRSALPVGLTGFAYWRLVARHGWRRSLVATGALLIASLFASMAWSAAYLTLNRLHWVP